MLRAVTSSTRWHFKCTQLASHPDKILQQMAATSPTVDDLGTARADHALPRPPDSGAALDAMELCSALSVAEVPRAAAQDQRSLTAAQQPCHRARVRAQAGVARLGRAMAAGEAEVDTALRRAGELHEATAARRAQEARAPRWLRLSCCPAPPAATPPCSSRAAL